MNHSLPIVIGCIALLAAYSKAVGFHFDRASIPFLAGVLILLLDLVFPLDMSAPLSAHMLQHIVMVLIVPPLLIAGFPPAWVRFMPQPQTALAWIAGIGTMALWHVPLFFDAAMKSAPVDILEHLSLLAGWTFFWLPVFHPREEKRLEPVPAVAYLAASCIACTVMGILITFSATGLYPAGGTEMMRNGRAMAARNDQQLAGLIMWVPGCLIYLSAMMAILARWYKRPEGLRA